MIGDKRDRNRVKDAEYFRELYPGMPDERVYDLLEVAEKNPDVHPKELKSLLKKKCRQLDSK